MAEKNKQKWEIIPDTDIYMLWSSPDLDETAEIHPDWYQHNGTPIDSEGTDMEYIATYVKC